MKVRRMCYFVRLLPQNEHQEANEVGFRLQAIRSTHAYSSYRWRSLRGQFERAAPAEHHVC